MPRKLYGDPQPRGPEREHARATDISADRRSFARALRKRMSLPEVLLWQQLRRGAIGGLRFRRQHAIGPYTADFYCHEHRLVVEIDSSWHAGREERDRVRTTWLIGQGYGVCRIEAAAVLKDPALAARGVWAFVQARRSNGEPGVEVDPPPARKASPPPPSGRIG